MSPEYAKQFGLGVFKFYWVEGGCSVGVIWNDEFGNRWFAVSNWISGPCCIWSFVDRVELIARQEKC